MLPSLQTVCPKENLFFFAIYLFILKLKHKSRFYLKVVGIKLGLLAC